MSVNWSAELSFLIRELNTNLQPEQKIGVPRYSDPSAPAMERALEYYMTRFMQAQFGYAQDTTMDQIVDFHKNLHHWCTPVPASLEMHTGHLKGKGQVVFDREVTKYTEERKRDNG